MCKSTEKTTISGKYISDIYSRIKEQNGFTIVTIAGEYVDCIGTTLSIKKKMPLRVTGKFDGAKLIVDNVLIETEDVSSLEQIFSGKRYEGVGKKTAQKALEKVKFYAKNLLHEEDIQKVPAENIQNVLTSECNISEPAARLIASDLTELYQKQKLFEDISCNGGNKSDVDILYAKYKMNAISKLKCDPYALCKEGVSFELCDKYGKASRYTQLDDKRLRAIFHIAGHMIEERQSICASYTDLIKIIRRIEIGAAFPSIDEGVLMSSILASRYFKSIIQGNELLIYPYGRYETEVNIAQEIKRLQQAAEPTGFSTYMGNAPLDEDQMAAMRFLQTGGIKIITGGPGAGKTTIIKEFITEYQKVIPGGKYYLCAPTGRAAVRISESSGLTACTIHKLLGYKPFSTDEDGKPMTEYNKSNQFPKGIFIIDEMSMVGEDIFLLLLSAIPNGSIVILSGDPRQLKSVDAGKVLEDLIESEVIPVQTLTKIHRQQDEASIVTNYYKIKDLNTRLVEDANFTIIKENSYEDAMKDILSYRDKYETKDPYSFQILTFVKGGNIGKDTINQKIAEEKKKKAKGNRYFGRTNYTVGDKIMMTANNYAEGYWNGDVGMITAIDDDSITALFYDGQRVINHDAIRDMDHAWGCTVHKAQGSEYSTVLVVVDGEYSNMLYNSIILTAITRAKDRVIIIETDGSLKKSIKRQEPSKRKTGLAKILRESLMQKLA